MRPSRPALAGVLTAGVLGVATLVLIPSARAQYSTNFDNLQGSTSLSDQDGWVTNDEYTGSTYNATPGNANGLREIGQSEDVTALDGFSTSASDQLAILGGVVNQAGGAVPGTNPVYVSHATGLPASSNVLLSTDYVVTPTGSTVRTSHDSFGFTFQNAAGGNLFSIDFVPTSTNSNTSDNVRYTVNGVQSAAPGVASFTLNARYHLVVSATVTGGTGGSFSAFLTPENPTGGENGTRITLASNVAFTGTIADIAATWLLASNTTAAATGTNPTDVPPGGNTNNIAYTNGGNNSMYIDNFSITVPEPSTYALLGLGAFGLAAVRRRRAA